MGSDEIMPELLRQQDPGSLGEGGWREVCHAGKAAVRSPPLQPDARLPARRESSKGRGRELEWDVSRLALRARGSWAGICWDPCRGDGAGVTQGVHGGVGTLLALRAAGMEVLVALDALGKGAGSGTPKSEPHLGKAAGALGMLTALPAGDVGASP